MLEANSLLIDITSFADCATRAEVFVGIPAAYTTSCVTVAVARTHIHALPHFIESISLDTL